MKKGNIVTYRRNKIENPFNVGENPIQKISSLAIITSISKEVSTILCLESGNILCIDARELTLLHEEVPYLFSFLEDNL